MKIGIISDTHCCCDPKFAYYLRDCDEIWHAGDIGDEETLRYFAGMGPVLRAVHGNIDGGPVRRMCPEVAEFETAGAKVLMTHIGGYPGRYAPGVRRMIMAAKPTIFVAGHNHLLRVMNDPVLGVLHINPGAAGYQGWQQVRTLITMHITDGRPHDLEVIELGSRAKMPQEPDAPRR